ncbi:conserved hypothetical protein [Magnetospirillum sp. LM-5]|uniref:YceD family protein n=1 Tax=Magnetospirillum sp. LM-5 TaxID=2681466 RepID=UPI0013857C07|nr:DUF177 domain-containing protein [Magnetospirillum sp. LM-5]CAA7613289.1 conserved hypothetical protein [Magnetospirillum sp. LM-5]
MIDLPPPEMSRLVRIDQISAKGTEMKVTASPAERAALADRFDLVEISALDAQVTLKAIAGGTMVRLAASITARLVQTCVVTLEPIEAEIDTRFSMTFGGGTEEDGGEIDLSIDDEDPPEPIVDGAIDVGEAIAEHLALAIDPFPRKPGTAYVGVEIEPPEPETKPNPFAALARFHEKKR